MNVSPIRQLLLVAQTAAQEQKLLACSVALKEIERDAARNNSRPARGLIRALLKSLPATEEVKTLRARLALLSAAPRHRKPKPFPPAVQKDIQKDISEEGASVVESAAPYIEKPVDVYIVSLEEVAPPVAPPSGYLLLSDGTSFRPCARCTFTGFCRRIAGAPVESWCCETCTPIGHESAFIEEKFGRRVESPRSVPSLHHHITAPPAEARADFKRLSEAAARQRQAAEARTAVARAQQEKEQYTSDVKEFSRLPLSRQREILGL
jgi:hypothetical protein